MGFFTGRSVADDTFPRGDRGAGDFNDYDYHLLARNKRITIVLAGSDPHQDELREILESADGDLETAITPRTIDQERTDERIVVRLFTGRRVSAPVGSIPRGLESVVDENLRRLDDKIGKARIPVRVVRKRGKFRVELLIGTVR